MGFYLVTGTQRTVGNSAPDGVGIVPRDEVPTSQIAPHSMDTTDLSDTLS